ncbi:hypothetical protein WMW72_10600 [Paenibacillus filicis]|uniref:Uncharacterized protein n=1 Tax=Paenibacillus filicis TaxID=669464 RepID=A0ABU9DJJ5_9BACL
MRKPIQYPVSPPRGDYPGIMPPQSVRIFKGLNTFDPLSIDDSFFTDMSNMTLDEYPTLTAGPGYSVLGTPVAKVLGLGTWKDAELHAVFADGTWRKWNGSAWTTLASGLNTTAEWTFTNFEGNLNAINLIGSNGVDPIKRYDGSTVQNLSGAPTGGNYITTYQNRLWCAVGKEVHACALDRPTEWTTFGGTDEDSYVKDIETSRGENVSFLSGSLSKLTIGTPNSLQELYGGIPKDFNVQIVSESEGFPSNKSAVTADGVMRFINRSGIYSYGGASLPDSDFSDVIKKFITGVDASCVAGSDGTRLYFRIGSRVLIYDTRSEVRSWVAWTGVNVTRFTIFQGELYAGDEAGRVIKLGGTTAGGAPISWRAVTKPFTNNTIAQKQRWLKLWTYWEFAAGSTLNVYLSKSISGDADWELVQTITGTGEPTMQRIIVPVNKYTLEHHIRIKFEGTGWARMHEYMRQIRQLSIH